MTPAPGPSAPPGHPTGSARGGWVSLVIPAYNEAARFDAGFARLRRAIDAGAIDPAVTEFVVVDDGSTDATEATARRLFAPLPHVKVVRLESNRGKGGAVRAGVAASSSPLVVFADADMAIDPDQVPLLASVLAGADVAIGSRSMPGATSGGASVRRRLMGRVFNRLVNTVTGLSIGDTQCGFKGFTAPAARLLFHLTVVDGFAFDVELLFIARRLGLRIEQVPVRWRNIGGTRIRPLADPPVMAFDILRALSGRRSPPPVPALWLASGDDGAGAARRLARGLLPVIDDEDGDIVVLFPLCDPDEPRRAAERLAAETPGLVTRVGSLSLAQLRSRAPLDLVGAGRPPTGASGLGGGPPTGSRGAAIGAPILAAAGGPPPPGSGEPPRANPT